MLCTSFQHPMLRSFRSMLPRLLVLAVAFTFEACDGGESPLAPANEPAAPAPSEAAASADAVGALTAQRIAFTSYATWRGDIYLVDAQGNNRTALTTWANTEFAPSWSWDHKHVALVRPRVDAANAQFYDIFLIDADGTHKHWAKSYTSSFHIMDPSWSPDGSRLVVTVTLQGTPYIATLELATGTLALVSQAGGGFMQGGDPSYDPTGQKILYVGSTGTTVDMVIPGSWHYGLVLSDTPVSGPTYSPDGKKIAYSRMVTGTNNSEIFVETLNVPGAKRLTNSGAYDGGPTWSPDGSRIAFASERSGRPQIWTMSSSTGGNLLRITHSDRDEVDPAWSH
jgi:Tol biopolymer transport system component